VEIAAPLAIRDASVLWPIRWNLLVNSAAALALLATVVVAGLAFRSYERGRRFEGQLEIARAVQSKLLPSRTDDCESVRTAAVYRPAEQVGGDFYDVFRTSAGAVALVIGDVSGKGMPAALLSGVIHGAVRSAAWSGSPEDQERESGRLNRLLCANSSGNRFASMFWCYYDRPARRLHYVNAGHCPPILVRRGEPAGTPVALDEGGPVLGLLADASYRQARREVHPGDLLVLYSDGLVECANAAGEEYGEIRLQELLRGAAEKDPAAVCQAVTGSVSDFLGAAAPRDDLTLVAAQFQ
jgi:sigma-B regulation protein RsbU (phosphoserine phosphatase)